MYSSSSNTIYVGNIQSIKDDQIREYFQRFGKIEAFYHNCTRAADEWLIDYRFIRFSSDTDMNAILTNKIDHIICRIRLDIHPYQAAFNDDTRLLLDRKICIAHTDSKLDRNVIKKAFTKYGRILNCTCVSSGNGVEYVYIEFESINSVRSVFANGQRHFAGRTSLAVKQPLKPSQVGAKIEKELREPVVYRQKLNSNVDTAQYSSFLVNYPTEENSRTLTPIPNRLSLSSDIQHSTQSCSQQQLENYEHDYDLILRQDFDEITYQTDKFLRNQKQSYKKVREFLLNELGTQSSSSSNEDGEIDSSSSSSTISGNLRYIKKKRVKSHH